MYWCQSDKACPFLTSTFCLIKSVFVRWRQLSSLLLADTRDFYVDYESMKERTIDLKGVLEIIEINRTEDTVNLGPDHPKSQLLHTPQKRQHGRGHAVKNFLNNQLFC